MHQTPARHGVTRYRAGEGPLDPHHQRMVMAEDTPDPRLHGQVSL